MLHKAAPEIASLRDELIAKLPGEVLPPLALWLSELDLLLTHEGLLELVEREKHPCFVGRPWQTLLPNLWDPTVEREIYWGVHDKAIGLRVVRGT